MNVIKTVLAVALTPLICAQASEDIQSEPASKPGGPEVRVTLGVATADNVFELGRSGLVRLIERDPCNLNNGRLTGMVSANERIQTTKIALDQKLDDVLGRKVTLSGGLVYHDYQENSAASYFEGDFSLTRKLGEQGRFRLGAELTGDRFRRNYLADVEDVNGNGNIPCRERQYAAGTYDEKEWSIGYRHRLTLVSGQESSSKRNLDIHVSGGVLERHYNQPHQNRDREGWFGEVRFEAELTPEINIETAWRRDTIDSPGANEVVLVDETLDGDVNGDRDVERNAPLVTLVDRSRARDTISIGVRLNILEDWRVILSYRHQASDFRSDNPLDIDHFGVDETEQRVSASVRWRFARRWFATLSWRQTDGEDIDNLGRDQTDTEAERISINLRRRLR